MAFCLVKTRRRESDYRHLTSNLGKITGKTKQNKTKNQKCGFNDLRNWAKVSSLKNLKMVTGQSIKNFFRGWSGYKGNLVRNLPGVNCNPA